MSETSPLFSRLQAQWIQDATHALLHVLKNQPTAFSNNPKHLSDVATLALDHLCRPGWPSADLSNETKEQIHSELLQLARPLLYSKDQKVLTQFANNAAAVIMGHVCEKKCAAVAHTTSEKVINPEQIAALLKNQLSLAKDPEEAIRQTARNIYQEQQRKKKNTYYLKLPPQDPLRTVLGLPPTQHTQLPKSDMRAHLLRPGVPSSNRNKEAVPLVDVLRSAAPFTTSLLKEALGDQLYSICKPVGYVDQRRQIISAYVPSSAMLHELSFRKHEIMQRLKQIRGFEHIVDVRFTVRRE